MSAIPSITINAHAQTASAEFTVPGYQDAYHIYVSHLWDGETFFDDDGIEHAFLLRDDGDADPEYFPTFHHAVEALLRAAADQMDIDRDREEEQE